MDDREQLLKWFMVMGAFIVVGCVELFLFFIIGIFSPTNNVIRGFPPLFYHLLAGRYTTLPFPLHRQLYYIHKTLYAIPPIVVLSSSALPFFVNNSTRLGSQVQDIKDHIDELKSLVVSIPVNDWQQTPTRMET